MMTLWFPERLVIGYPMGVSMAGMTSFLGGCYAAFCLEIAFVNDSFRLSKNGLQPANLLRKEGVVTFLLHWRFLVNNFMFSCSQIVHNRGKFTPHVKDEDT